MSDQQLLAGFLNFKDLASAGTAGVLNAGQSRVWGAEIQTTLLPFENFKLDFSGAYLNSRIVSEPPEPSFILLTDQAGGPTPFTPKYKGSVTGTYTLPIEEGLGKVSLGANYVYTSKYITAALPSLTYPSGTPFGYVKSSSLLNLFLNWDGISGSPVSASFFMTNVTNYKYSTFVAGLYSALGFETRTLGEPRMWGFRLRYDFGE